MDPQRKVLAEADSLISLQAKFNKLDSLETTDQATSHLHTPLPASVLKGSSETATQKTPYTQLKNSRKLALSQKNGQGTPVCKGCGETVHPPGKSMARKDCPAFSLTCRDCGIKGHLEKVCRQPKRSQKQSSSYAAHCLPQPLEEMPITQSTVPSPPPATGPAEFWPDVSYIFAIKPNPESQKAPHKRRHRQRQRQRQRKEAEEAGLQPNYAHKTAIHQQKVRAVQKEQETVTHKKKIATPHSWAAHVKLIAIPHMEWNGTSFIEKHPAAPPVINVQASVMHRAHKSFGKKWQNDRPAPTEIGLQAYTDTCAQTCTSGPEILSMLQCHSSYLVPTTHGIHGITDKPLDIMGGHPVAAH